MSSQRQHVQTVAEPDRIDQPELWQRGPGWTGRRLSRAERERNLAHVRELRRLLRDVESAA